MCAAASVVFFCLSLIWAQLARVMPSTAFFYEVSDFSPSGGESRDFTLGCRCNKQTDAMSVQRVLLSTARHYGLSRLSALIWYSC